MRKSLNGIWKLNSSFLKEKAIFDLKCQVPGSIYNDLLKNKIIDDPFYRDNEIKMLDLMKYDYAYSRAFSIKKEELKKEINLGFLGLDTVCVIYVNDLDIEMPQNYVSKTYKEYCYDWGGCSINWENALGCVNSKIETSLFIFLRNNEQYSVSRQGRLYCVAKSDNTNNFQNRLCQQITGQNTPYGDDSFHICGKQYVGKSYLFSSY